MSNDDMLVQTYVSFHNTPVEVLEMLLSLLQYAVGDSYVYLHDDVVDTRLVFLSKHNTVCLEYTANILNTYLRMFEQSLADMLNK